LRALIPPLENVCTISSLENSKFALSGNKNKENRAGKSHEEF